MQSYGRLFAKVYNQFSIGFVNQVAPRIREYYETVRINPQRTILDLCCGTGQLASCFLEWGYRIVGLDLSADMLCYARENVSQYLQAGKAKMVQADATKFKLDETFGLVVSTYDSLNHLPNQDALHSCFKSVFSALNSDGIFIFDLNTRYGLRQRWNSVLITDMPEAMIVNRKFFDGGKQAYAKVTGFLRNEDGSYERFEESFYNTVFEMEWVKLTLLEEGFKSVYFAEGHDLFTPIENPETLLRTFVIAQK